MSTEEAERFAWKMPLALDLLDWITEHAKGVHGQSAQALERAIYPHIQAAEERGRREAAREIRASIATWEGMSGYAAACMGGKSAAADLIDPDKP